jgi:hypothetical protein
MTNLSFSVVFEWPNGYKQFISYFNLINFDLVKISSVDCVVRTDYYDKYMLFSVTPIGIGACVVVFYLLPKYYKVAFNDNSEDARRQSNRRFWRMFVYALFLVS